MRSVFSRNQTGFSLVEMMVVLAIIGIMVGASVPVLIPYLRHMGINSFTNELVTKINSGKMRAAKINSRVRVFFDYGATPNRVSVDQIDSANAVVENYYTAVVPDGVEFFPTGSADTFDGHTTVFTAMGENTKLDGTPQSGDVQFRLINETSYIRRVEINRIGAIRVYTTAH